MGKEKMEIPQDKPALRRFMLEKLKTHPQAPEDYPGLFQHLSDRLDAGFTAILTFQSLPGEPDLTPWLQERPGIPVFFPRIEGDSGLLTFRKPPAPGAPWEVHPLGFRQPAAHAEAWDPSAFSSTLVLVPGLAFDKTGGRLGRGKGFYDRFLSQCPANCFSLGIGWDFQVVSRVPRDPWDCRLQGLATPTLGLIF